MSQDEVFPQEMDYQVLQRIGPICDTFEADFRRNCEPIIEDYLVLGMESDRNALLLELLKLDREYRGKQGKTLPYASYANRFPNDHHVLQFVFVDAGTMVGESTRELRAEHSIRDLPRRLGQYELLQILGHGGMGVVYRAMQYAGDVPIREVALKLIRTDQWFGDEDTQSSVLLARFREETRFAAQLDHPNIVTVFDVGQIDGLDYFSMQWIDGSDLSAVVKEKPIGYRKIAETLIPVAKATAFAHSKGIVHRDLKPRNILLDAQLKPFIADFGLAKSTSGNSDLTQTGQILGTGPGTWLLSRQLVSTKRLGERPIFMVSVGCCTIA